MQVGMYIRGRVRVLCVMMKWVVSDGLVLDGFLGVDDPLLVEYAVSAVGALDRIVGFELALLAALYITTRLLLLPHT